MNIGLIGLGYWGKNILRNLIINDQIGKVFVYDIGFKKNDLKKNISYVNDKKKFFKENIDIYIITTPTKTHFTLIKDCLDKNKTVCITKPFVSKPSEVFFLEKKYKSINKIFLDHTYLFHSSIRYLKSLVKKKNLES
tara:strand:- start:247 stop:657 length:411 start_codon:yes stop_codon:yes gene_type:complete